MHTYEIWAAIAVGLYGLKAAKRIAGNTATRLAFQKQERLRINRQAAIDAYVETGKGTAQVAALGGRTLKAVAARRAARIDERASESTEFQCICECPACGLFAVHWIEDLWFGKEHRNLIRRCRGCDYGWYQR